MAAERLLVELARVEVAQEELRSAEEELRVQQDQITRLLLRHDAERRWRGHVSALLPIGLGLTDGNGALVEANPALAARLGAGVQRLRGKPLSVYLSTGDVRPFRSALRELGSGRAAEQSLAVTLRPRSGPAVPARMFGFTEVADDRATLSRIQWLLVPEPSGGRAGEVPDGMAEDGGPPPATGPSPDGSAEAVIPTSRMVGLVTSLAELSLLPTGDGDRQRMLTRMATVVSGAVPAADWVSIALGSPGKPRRVGSDSPEAQAFDGRQVEAGEGPCREAHDRGTVVVAGDVTRDPRWPRLATSSRAGEVRSVLALPLHQDGVTIGAVTICSGRRGAFDPAGLQVAEVAAATVAGVLHHLSEREALQQLAADLERALTSRAVIDQAKGLVMGRLGVPADDAFARLVSLSRRFDVKLRDLAGLVVGGYVDDVLGAAD